MAEHKLENGKEYMENTGKFDSEREAEFDAALLDNTPKTPPDDVVEGVTPWRRFMRCALIGVMLNLLTFHFLNLDYILPGIGLLFALIGFRALRRENRWFGACFFLIILRGIYYLFVMIADSSISQEKLHQGNGYQAAYIINLIMLFILCICLGNGFRAVLKKSGQSAKLGAAAALPLWYCILFALALVSYNGNIVTFFMLAAYVFIFYSFFRLAELIDTAGYVICPAPVMVPDAVIVLGAVGLLAGGLLCNWLFLNRYPMKWEILETQQDGKTEEIKEELIAKGFPEEVLRDMTEEEIRECEGALRVYFTTGKSAVKGVNEKYPYEGVPGQVVYYDKKVFCITEIAVELPGEEGLWKIIHHYHWTVAPGFYGTEAIQLWPTWHHDKDWVKAGEITGRILYDKGSETYTAPYYYLEECSDQYNEINMEYGLSGEYDDIFFDNLERKEILAAFSVPKNAANCRAYLAYTTKLLEADDNSYISSWSFYTHQNRYFQYPAWSATGYRINVGMGSQDAFETFHSALQTHINQIPK